MNKKPFHIVVENACTCFSFSIFHKIIHMCTIETRGTSGYQSEHKKKIIKNVAQLF